MSIRIKLLVGPLGFLALFILVFLLTLYVTSRQASDGLSINLSGRQRMLSQSMTKDLLAYTAEPTDENWATLDKSAKLFDSTLKSLQNGGSVQLSDTESAMLPAPDSAELLARLNVVAGTWGEYQSAINDARAKTDLSFDAIDNVVSFTPEAIAAMNRVVVRAQQLDDQSQAAQVVNLVGRQRLLTQRIVAEALLYAQTMDAAGMDTAAAAFEATHTALKKGGKAPARMDNTGEIELPAAAGKLLEALVAADPQWNSLKELLGQWKSDPSSSAARSQIVTAGNRLIALMDAATLTAQTEAASNSNAAYVNFAGRQRLLLQKVATLSLAYHVNPTSANEQQIKAAMQHFKNTHDALANGGTVVTDVDANSGSATVRALADAVVSSELRAVGEKWTEYTKAIDGLIAAEKAKRAALQKANQAAQDLVTGMNQAVLVTQEGADANVAMLQRVQVVSLIIGLLIIAATVFLANKIGKSIAEAADVAKTVAQGDLTIRREAKSKDEAGQLIRSMNEMADRLSDLVGKVQYSGVAVSSSSTEIAASSREQEATVSELAATAKEIAATTTEISATANELLHTMNEVASVSENTAGAAASSKLGLENMERTMGQMVDSASAITNKLSVLSEKASNISSVVTTIMKVADQTNLLSLNAAIEAEKAGEFGLGFAVVANEVRRLADQTAMASTDIETMVKEMQSAVSAAVMGMDGFTGDIRHGSDSVRDVVGQLNLIIRQVQDLVPRFENVKEGMTAQTQGAAQISEGVNLIVESSEQAAEGVRQANLAIIQLNEAAQELRSGVSQFKVNASAVDMVSRRAVSEVRSSKDGDGQSAEQIRAQALQKIAAAQAAAQQRMAAPAGKPQGETSAKAGGPRS